MAFSISQFIDTMVNDGARPNLFRINFVGLAVGGAAGAQTFSLRAKATQIPSSTIGVAPAYYFGRMAKFAGNRTFDNWTVTVLNDENHYIDGPRFYLEQWSSKLNTHVSNKRVKDMLSPTSYQQDAEIIHYGKSGNIISTYTMKRCFPIDISAIGLDWGQNDTIEEYTVTFAMQWWQSTGSDVGDASAPDEYEGRETS